VGGGVASALLRPRADANILGNLCREALVVRQEEGLTALAQTPVSSSFAGGCEWLISHFFPKLWINVCTKNQPDVAAERKIKKIHN
jgi:hypothetical protein